MDTTYIFGHRKPDTDSVTSAIALSYLKNKLGGNTTPVVLGNLNNETEYVLNHFNVKAPKYLNDVKLQIKDVNYHKDCYIKSTSSIQDGYLYMENNHLTGLPIVNDEGILTGYITIKDIARQLVKTSTNRLNTTMKNILKLLNGEEILSFDDKIEGDILVAAYRSTTFLKNVVLDRNTILIVGDRHSIIEYAVNAKVKLLIVDGNGEIKQEHLEIAKQNKVNIIRTNYDTMNTSRLITLSNYITEAVTNDHPVWFNENEYFDNFEDINNRLRHTNYPIVDDENKCLGLLSVTDIMDKTKKKVILVDHNEKAQSVEGLEEAEVLEIVDHHKLGSLSTAFPINFRNMAVGSTNTILYYLYQENKEKIPADIAGLMLSGIISDTLLLKSPTTTELDKIALMDLSKLANIDYENYGMEMLKAGTSLKGKTKEEILYTDFKTFNIDEEKIGVGQIMTMSFDELEKEIPSYVELLNDVAMNNDYQLVALYITDIIKNGSYVIFNESGRHILENSFDIENLKQGHYFDGVVSRKKQIIPNIVETLEKK